MKKVLLFALILLTAAAVFGQQKFALVIGNGQYSNFGSLRNAVNDANDMADALKGLGFNVDKVINGNLNQMESAAVKLKNQLGANSNSYGFFFYAGHGVQWQGENYLIPVDATIPDSDFLRQRAVSVQAILDMLNKTKNALNIIVLDACRDFPAVWSRSTDRGLAVVHPPADSIIMYATGAGRTASDGTGRNGLFTTHLLTYLKTPGIEVNDLFRRTMSAVARASNNEQRPALYTDFAETAYLGTRPVASAPAPAPAVQPTPAPTPAPAPAQPTPAPAQSTPALQFTALGISLGTGFSAPAFIGTVAGDISLRTGGYFTLGMDMGLGNVSPDTDYVSLSPSLHFTGIVFLGNIPWRIGAGAGYAYTNSTAPEGDLTAHAFNADVSTSFNFPLFIESLSGEIGAGAVYAYTNSTAPEGELTHCQQLKESYFSQYFSTI